MRTFVVGRVICLFLNEGCTMCGNVPLNTPGLYNSAWWSISVLLYVIIAFKLYFEFDSSILLLPKVLFHLMSISLCIL